MKHPFKKVVVVTKETVTEKFFSGKRGERLREKLGEAHPTIKGVDEAHREHGATLHSVEKLLKGMGVRFMLQKSRHLRSLKSCDLVITIGGDGTLLKTSHFIGSQLVLPVNSAPSQSVGALCSVTAQNLERKLHQILKGEYRVEPLHRIQIQVNGVPLDYAALNDVLYANNCPAGTSRYVLKFKSNKEAQKSSGLWIATAAGSTAAINAAGGKQMKPHRRELQFLIREPYRGGVRQVRFVRGILNPRQKLEITNNTAEASLFIDGTQGHYRLSLGDQITFRSHPQPLNRIG